MENIRIQPRKLARSMARAQMRTEKLKGVNKVPEIMGRRGKSIFAREWKRFAIKAKDAAIIRERSKKKRKAAKA